MGNPSLDNEMVSMVRRFHRGIEPGKLNTALGLIKQLGPGANFMDADDTVKNLKKGEFWEPKISNRGIYNSKMTKEKHDVLARARAMVKEILSSQKSPTLDEKTNKELSAIIANFEANHIQ